MYKFISRQIIFTDYNTPIGMKLSDMIERYKERTGSYPERILADKIAEPRL